MAHPTLDNSYLWWLLGAALLLLLAAWCRWEYQQSENDRANNQSYDPQSSYTITLLKVSRSAIPKVLIRVDFWLLLLGHLTLFGCFSAGVFGKTGGEAEMLLLLKLGWSGLNVLFLVTTTVLAFALNQSFSRHVEVAESIRKAMTAIYDFIFEAQLLFAGASMPYERLAGRWLVASMLLALSEVKSSNFKMDRQALSEKEALAQEKQFAILQELQIVKDDEAEFLALGNGLSVKTRLLVMSHTAADVCKQGLTEVKKDSSVLEASLMAKLIACKTTQEQMMDLCCTIMPFEYFHLLTLLVTVTVSSLGCTMAFSETWLSPVAYIICVLVILGLMEVIGAMQAPLQNGNEAHLPINAWSQEFTSSAHNLLNHYHVGSTHGWDEELKREARLKPNLALDLVEVNLFLHASQRAPFFASLPDSA